MPKVIACNTCSAKLKVPDGFKAPKVTCPKCQSILFLKSTAPVAVEPNVAPNDPNVGFERVEGDDESLVEEQPRRRMRKRRRPAHEGMPGWVSWALCGGAVVAAVVALALIISLGGPTARGYGIYLAIAVPISSVLLIVSMVIASAVGGGIDFGEIHIAILKAAGLVTAVTVVSLIPYWGLITILIWCAGLKFLFHLDNFEVGLLVFINWGLNRVLAMFLLTAIVAAANNRANKEDGHFDGEIPDARRHVVPSALWCSHREPQPSVSSRGA